ILQLRKGIEILVATPGRLLDHVQNKTLMLNQVSVLILDEADRMLDMGFMPDIRRIIALLPPVRQNLLFSATFPDEIKSLAKSLLRDPVQIQVARANAVADLVSHVVHPVSREKKRELLTYVIQTRGLKQVLVFSGTRIGANRLAHQLRKDHIQADAIHGDKTQAEREAALEAFKAGKTAVLVATDVASRGLDIEGLPQVINFDVPRAPEDYVHRIGRTGRAGMKGEAISLVAPEDAESIVAIEKLIKKPIERVLVPGFEPNAGTVATMMTGHPRGEGIGNRGRPRREEGGRMRSQAPRPKRDAPPSRRPPFIPPQQSPRNQDPIFSKPYEPGAGTAAPAAPQPAAQSSVRRVRPVAALLGGLKR
ncbi:MAG: DEAD/DEAH box helicase, partial [Betaproteobacteria bacterium]|nr:DEAD/DEAH box helicase [Betaproteobacteria bacterium]